MPLSTLQARQQLKELNAPRVATISAPSVGMYQTERGQAASGAGGSTLLKYAVPPRPPEPEPLGEVDTRRDDDQQSAEWFRRFMRAGSPDQLPGTGRLDDTRNPMLGAVDRQPSYLYGYGGRDAGPQRSGYGSVIDARRPPPQAATSAPPVRPVVAPRGDQMTPEMADALRTGTAASQAEIQRGAGPTMYDMMSGDADERARGYRG